MPPGQEASIVIDAVTLAFIEEESGELRRESQIVTGGNEKTFLGFRASRSM